MLQTIIQTLKESLSKIAPRITDLSLNVGASDADIAKLERTIGKTLPEDFKELYRSINGNNDDENFGNFAYGQVLSSIDQIIASWNFRKEFSSKFDTIGLSHFHPQIDGSNFYNLNWLEIGNTSGRDGLFLDLAPTDRGTYGQIIFLDGTDNVGILVANSTQQLLEQFISDLDNGQYYLAEDALDDGNHWLETKESIDLNRKIFALKKGAV
ncbi:SMI1/KNR4 family protein [Nostoc ellipsosporum NOK]|nr:SMI1/KNR4 family protein [Nostoc ellipsosporum NOK]